MKKIILTFFTLLILSFGGYFVFANLINNKIDIKLNKIIGKNIYPDSKNLNFSILIFKSNKDISNYKITNSCKSENNFLGQKDNFYIFKLKLLDNLCENDIFYLKNNKKNIKKIKLNIIKKSDIFNLYSDYSNKQLEKIKKDLNGEIKRFSKYKEIKSKNLFFIESNRTYKELIYKKNILKNIVNRRKLRYQSPVVGYKITTKLNQIPNAGRPYRSIYTDGIHHGWDIMAPKGTPVVALDDGIIIRIANNFDFEDINSNIIKNGKISHSQKIRNLDILRGQQVWLKTTKGDVVFYSHLSKIYDNIREGSFVSVGEKLGEIGSSGVPDKDYKDFHLHFPIMKNPHITKKAGKYYWEDIMNWDWYLKGLNPDEVLKKQKKIFVDNAF